MSGKNGRVSFGEPQAEYITRVMTQQGFEPSRVYNAFFIEFSKTYSDSLGRIARAVVQFERPNTTTNAGETRLSGFTVLVQAHVEASVEAISERAPPVMQDDLVGIVEAFQHDTPRSAVALERCSSCRAPVSEFFVVKGVVFCRACKEE